MLVAILLTSSVLFLGTTVFFGMRVANAVRSATEAERNRDRVQNDLKKVKERLSKADKKIKSAGNSSAKDDRRTSELKGAVDDLRRQLGEARKGERSAHRRADAVEQMLRESKRDAEASEEEFVELRARLRKEEAEAEGSGSEEVAREPEPVIKETKKEDPPKPDNEGESEESRRVTRANREIEKLKESLRAARNDVRLLQRDLGTTRRKSEHQRRAYLVTQRQLELAQDLLEVMETDAGTTANAVLLEKSKRAKKRHEIRQGRAKSKAEAEMPPQIDGPVVRIPDPPEEPPEPEILVSDVQTPEESEISSAHENDDAEVTELGDAIEEVPEHSEGEDIEEAASDDEEGAEVHQLNPVEAREPTPLPEGSAVEVSSTVVRRRRKTGGADSVED